MRNCFLIAYPFAAFLRRGTGHEMINEGAQLNELTGGKAGNVTISKKLAAGSNIHPGI
jgi:hypothetical protein